MLKPESLLVYPYVKVRVSCQCGYRKAYRLARLAEHYGAECRLEGLLFSLMCGRCPLWGQDAALVRLRCEAVYTDLGSENPPDAPPSAIRPRLLK